MKSIQIKYTYDLLTAGGTDSGEIHKTLDGVINMTVSIPCRYFHSHVSLVHYDDIEATIELLVAVIKGVDWDLIAQLKRTKYE